MRALYLVALSAAAACAGRRSARPCRSDAIIFVKNLGCAPNLKQRLSVDPCRRERGQVLARPVMN